MVNGSYHVNGTITQSSTGADYKVHVNTQGMQGVGLSTGLK